MTTPPPPPPAAVTPPVPPPGPGARSPGLAGRGPLVVACAAAAVALLSAVVALYAVSQANEARRQADLAVLAGGGQPGGGQSGRGQSVPTGDGTRPPAATTTRPGSTTGPTPTPLDVLNPTASYTIAYPPGQILNPQATTSSSAYIDLDEPRVGADQDKADLRLSVGSSSSVPFFELYGDAQGAVAPTAQMEAKACADLIRTGPLAEGVDTAAQRGTNLCVATSRRAARTQGIKQRIVLIVVTALSQGGVPTVQITAWEVPG